MTSPQSLADGAAGIALLHLETGNWPAARAALHQATVRGVTIADGASLYYGAPALAFVLAGTSHPALARARVTAIEGTATVTRRRLDAAHRRIDTRLRPVYSEYDLIRGLTGLGVVLRQTGSQDLLCEVLAYLVRLTQPLDGLPGWWCSNSPDRSQPPPPGGHSNHGMAHGITGPLALLALTCLDGTTVPGQQQAITVICQWLDTCEQHASTGTWWPQTLALGTLRRPRTTQRGPLRPSWCYGTPGIARAQQLAGLALKDRARQQRAETAFTDCATDPAQTARLTGGGLCHGTAGLLAAGHRIAADASICIPLTTPSRLHQHVRAQPGETPGFLDGAAGADLVSAATAPGRWDACLLLS